MLALPNSLKLIGRDALSLSFPAKTNDTKTGFLKLLLTLNPASACIRRRRNKGKYPD